MQKNQVIEDEPYKPMAMRRCHHTKKVAFCAGDRTHTKTRSKHGSHTN